MSGEVNRNKENDAPSMDNLGGMTEGTDAPKKLAATAGAVPAGKGGTNPLHPAVANETPESSAALPEADSETGGEG